MIERDGPRPALATADTRHPLALRDDQRLALEACLRTGPAAIDAWERWKQVAHLDDLEPGTFRLAPLIYRHLSALGVRDPALGRFKGIYRATWCANQVLFRAMLPLVSRLQDRGVRVMLLKGTALSALHYRDLGARPMADLDVMVPRVQVPQALDVLAACRLTRAPGAPDRFNETLARLFHAYTYEDASGRHLDLHWRLFAPLPDSDDDEAVWDAAVPVDLLGVRALALCPADQLLHVCGHGVAWNHVPPLRWISDAAAVLRASGDAMDWQRLRARAAHHDLVLALRAGLKTLEAVSGLAPPDGFLASLDAMPVSFGERIEFEASIHPLGLASWAARARMGGRAVARSPQGHRLEALGEVVRYITRTDKLSETPGLLARRLAWRLRRSASAVAESARSRH
jgi:hypothetical protein